MASDVLARAKVVIGGDNSALDAALEGAQSSMRKTGDKLQDIGTKLTAGLTVPLAGFGFAVGKAFIDFESSFAGIRKTLSASAEEFTALEKANRNLAKSIPISVNELNRIGELAGQLGIRGVENITKFEDTIAKLAVTTNLTADDAALSLAQIINILQLNQGEVVNLGAAIVGLGNNFATVETQIVDFTQRIAGAGAIAGLTAGDVTGIGTAFASVGVQAEAGGTAIQQIILKMVEAVELGGEELKVFDKTVAFTGKSFSEIFRKDAGEAFQLFVKGLGLQGKAAIGTLDGLSLEGERVARAFLSVSGAGDLLQRAMARGNEEFSKATALQDEATKRFATSASQLKILWNNVKDVAITLGSAFIPILVTALNQMRPFIELAASLAEWFKRLPEPVRATALSFATFLAIIGPLTAGLGLFTKALVAMNFAPVIAGIGGVVKAGVALAASTASGAFASLASTAFAAGLTRTTAAFSAMSLAMFRTAPAALGLGAALNVLKVALGPVGWIALGITAIIVVMQKWAKQKAELKQQFDDLSKVTATYRDNLLKLSDAQILAQRTALTTAIAQQKSVVMQLDTQIQSLTASLNAVILSGSKAVPRDQQIALQELNAQRQNALRVLSQLATQENVLKSVIEEVSLAWVRAQDNQQTANATTVVTTKLTEDATEALTKFVLQGQQIEKMQVLLGTSFNASNAQLERYRSIVEALTSENISFTATLPGINTNLLQLSQTLIELQTRGVSWATATAAMRAQVDQLSASTRGAASSDTLLATSVTRTTGTLTPYNTMLKAVNASVIANNGAQQIYNSLIEGTITPLQAYMAQTQALRTLLAAKTITQEQFNAALKQAQILFDEASLSASKHSQVLLNVATNAVGGFGQAMVGWANKSSDAWTGFLKQLRNELIKLAALKVFQTVLNFAFPGSGFVTKLFAGFFAGGGFLAPGKFGVVGEAGPELVMAGRGGLTITPAIQQTQSGGTGAGVDVSSLAAELLASLGPPPIPMSPEAVAQSDYYRNLFSAMVRDGRRRGVIT